MVFTFIVFNTERCLRIFRAWFPVFGEDACWDICSRFEDGEEMYRMYYSVRYSNRLRVIDLIYRVFGHI